MKYLVIGLVFLFSAGWVHADDLPFNETFGGDFLLPSTLGHDISLAELNGSITLMAFGYTQCPDICPTLLMNMNVLIRSFDDDKKHINALFVTVDPERDTLEYLTNYLGYFSSNFIGIRPSLTQLDKFTGQYGVFYLKNAMSDGNYSMSHTAYIYLFDQQGRLRKFYDPFKDLEQLRADMNYLLAAKETYESE